MRTVPRLRALGRTQDIRRTVRIALWPVIAISALVGGAIFVLAPQISNLFVNAGQGSNGWTQACGCGRVVADIVSGRQPEIDLEGFGIDRIS